MHLAYSFAPRSAVNNHLREGVARVHVLNSAGAHQSINFKP